MIPRTLKVWGIFLLAPLPPAPPKPAHQGRPHSFFSGNTPVCILEDA